MARVKGAMMTRKRRKKILKRAKGYWGEEGWYRPEPQDAG